MIDVHEAIRLRKSVRAFQDRAVSRESIDTILETAKHSPSGVNTQPWKVAVVSGDVLKRMEERIVADFEANGTGTAEYEYYPVKWKSPYIERRKACGYQLYDSLGIKREDTERRMEQWKANYRAFGAPAVLMCFIDRDLEPGSYMDYGMFMQSIMIAAVAEGLATCPEASFADFPGIIREELSVDAQYIVLGGIAIGYEDTSAPVNNYRTPRVPLSEFVSYHGL